jgi:hypothetical protein
MPRTLFTYLLIALTSLVNAQQQKLLKPDIQMPEVGYTNIRIIMREIPTVKVKVNGVDLIFGVDTGCQGLGVLTEAAAAKLNLKPEMTLPTMGNTGKSELDYVRIDKLEMGGGTWSNFHVPVLALKGMKFDGLIGADILFKGPFYMDLTNRTMLIGAMPDTSAAHEVPCFSRGGHCNVNIVVDGRKVPVLIDSGASRSYLTSMKFTGKTIFRGYGSVATVRGVSFVKQEVCLIKSTRLGDMPLKGITFYRDEQHNILGDDFLMAQPIAIDRDSRRVWLFPAVGTDKAAAKSKQADVKGDVTAGKPATSPKPSETPAR